MTFSPLADTVGQTRFTKTYFYALFENPPDKVFGIRIYIQKWKKFVAILQQFKGYIKFTNKFLAMSYTVMGKLKESILCVL